MYDSKACNHFCSWPLRVAPSGNTFRNAWLHIWTSAPVPSAMCCASYCEATTLSYYQLVQAYHTTTLIPGKPWWKIVCRAVVVETVCFRVRLSFNVTYSMYHNTNLYTTTCSQQQDSRTGKGTNHTPTDWSLTRVGGFRSRGLGVESLRSTAHNVATGFFVSTCDRRKKGRERWKITNFERLIEQCGLRIKETEREFYHVALIKTSNLSFSYAWFRSKLDDHI